MYITYMHAYTYTCAYIPIHTHISFILNSAPHTHAYIDSLTLNSVLAELECKVLYSSSGYVLEKYIMHAQNAHKICVHT